jgi:hypothetical protein
MRLKDPLQGVKMAQSHVVIHAVFFLTGQFMISLDDISEEYLNKVM